MTEIQGHLPADSEDYLSDVSYDAEDDSLAPNNPDDNPEELDLQFSPDSYNPHNTSLDLHNVDNNPEAQNVESTLDVPATRPLLDLLMQHNSHLRRFIDIWIRRIDILKNPPPGNTPQGPSKDVD